MVAGGSLGPSRYLQTTTTNQPTVKHYLSMWTAGHDRIRFICLTADTLQGAVAQARRYGERHPEWGALVEVWRAPMPFAVRQEVKA